MFPIPSNFKGIQTEQTIRFTVSLRREQSKAGIMWFGEEKSHKLAIILAMVSAVTPLSGFHKFYLRQYRWGMVYLFVSVTFMSPVLNEGWVLPYLGVAQVASFLEGVWYFFQSEEAFNARFNEGFGGYGGKPLHPHLVMETANALRELDQLREEGLLSEYEFEQQRRQLVEGVKK